MARISVGRRPRPVGPVHHDKRLPGSRGVGLAIVLTGLFMASLDVAIVNVAAPQVRQQLHLSPTALIFVVSGYTLSYAMLLITGARLGDDYGHGRFFTAGVVGFTITSLLCGLAPDGGVLIAARVAQGATAAAMVPQVLSIIQTRFDGPERTRAVGLYATVLAVGAVVGQVAGGALVTADIFGSTWRPVFLVNVPIGAGLAFAARRHLGSSRAASRRAPDWGGVALLSVTVLAIVFPLIVGQQQQWPPWTYASLAAGAGMLAATIAYLVGRQRRGRDPLVDVTIFQHRAVCSGLSSLLAMQIAYGGFLLTLTLHLQAGLGYSPLQSGLTFAPFAAGFAATSLTHTKLGQRTRRWAPLLGLCTLGVGYATLGNLDHSAPWHTAPSLAILAGAGAGFGSGFSPMIARTAADIPRRLVSEVSGTVSTVVNVGFVIGAAALGSLYINGAHETATSSAHAFARATLPMAALAALAAALAVPPRPRPPVPERVAEAPTQPMEPWPPTRHRIGARLTATSRHDADSTHADELMT